MPEEPKIEDNKDDNKEIVVKHPGSENLIPRKIGDPKIPGAGKKKGYRSAKVILRQLMEQMNVKDTDTSKMTVLQAMFWAQVELAIKKQDRDALKFLLEQSGELNRMEVPRMEGGNLFNIESMKAIISGGNFLEAPEQDEEFEESEEEATEVKDMQL
jgi:hypothetical protein